MKYPQDCNYSDLTVKLNNGILWCVAIRTEYFIIWAHRWEYEEAWASTGPSSLILKWEEQGLFFLRGGAHVWVNVFVSDNKIWFGPKKFLCSGITKGKSINFLCRIYLRSTDERMYIGDKKWEFIVRKHPPPCLCIINRFLLHDLDKCKHLFGSIFLVRLLMEVLLGKGCWWWWREDILYIFWCTYLTLWNRRRRIVLLAAAAVNAVWLLMIRLRSVIHWIFSLSHVTVAVLRQRAFI